MDAGQMTMMMQLPTSAGLSSAKSVPTSGTAASAQGQSDTVFAGMLSGMSPVLSAQPEAVVGAEKSGSLGTPVTNKQASPAVQLGDQLDVTAMLQAAMESGTQLAPANAPTTKDAQEKSAKEMQSGDPVPQDEAQGALGSQRITPDVMAMLLAAMGTGNQAPAVNASTVEGPQEKSVEMVQSGTPISQNVMLRAAGAQLVPPTQTNGRTPETDAGRQQADEPTQKNHQVGGVAATIDFVNNADSQTDGGIAAKVAASQQLPGNAPLEQGMVQAAAASNVLSPEMAAQQPAFSLLSETAMPFSQPSTVSSNSTAAAQSPRLETVGKAETLSSDSVKGAPSASAKGTNGQIAGADAGVVTTVSGTSTDKLAGSDISKEVSQPHEAVVPHAPATGTSIAGNQQRVDHTPETTAIMAENSANSSGVSQVANATGDLTDGSGTTGKKSDESIPKPAEAPTNVTQQLAGGHQSLSSGTPTSAPLQSAPVETARPESHEQVARQVQEQLTNHNLKPGNDQITFKLSPDNLGDIKVNLSLEDHHLKVEIVAETRVARDSLLQHVDSLKESLARQNISVDKFNVTTGGGGTGSQGNNNSQWTWSELAQNRQSQQWLSTGGYRTPMVEAAPLAPTYLAQAEHAMVDLHF